MMNPTFDTIVVGGGLAGACAALHLSRHERVLVLEADRPAAGASGAAAGLVNPLTGLRARPVWRMDEALDAFHETLHLAGAGALFRGPGVLRPARDADQAAVFREAADRHPAHARWLAPADAAVRHPAVAAAHGALWLTTAGAVDVRRLVEALLAAARSQGAVLRTNTRVAGWDETDEAATVTIASDEGRRTIAAARVVLAAGDRYVDFPELAALHLHRVKGQVIRVQHPDPEALADLPHLAGNGYVVRDGDAFVVGSSYEHDFTDLAPSPEQTRRLFGRAAALVPALGAARVIDARAGVRVNVPGTRLPMLGPLPGRRRVWVFTGLGSKGLLMAPLLARHLRAAFADPASVPREVRVRLRPV